MKGRIKITMEFHPDKGNPVVVQDSIVIDDDDLLGEALALYNTTAHRFVLDVEGAERGAL
jgi:phosphoenolpyruvate carboxylase